MRKKSVFGKIGFLALVVALLAGTTGVAYGMWSQTVNIDVSTNTGTLDSVVTLPTPTNTAVTDITFLQNGVTNINVTIKNPVNTSYTAPFSIANTGTIPIKIQKITFSGLPSGVTAVVSGLLKGDQLDPGASVNALITITVNTNPLPATFTLNTAVETVQWNLYTS